MCYKLSMCSTYAPVIAILGAGPGLGMSVAHRFGAAGYTVALLSRNATKHPEYLAALEQAGIEAAAFDANAAEPEQLRAAIEAVKSRFGRIDVGYFGPAGNFALSDIVATTAAEARDALLTVPPAVDFASLLLPDLRQRGAGSLVFAGGLSSVVPMPPLGGLALASAALRNYAITLNAALAPEGVYVGTVTIGGVILRSAAHQQMTDGAIDFAGEALPTLDPDELAETVWQLVDKRDAAEAVVT